MATGFHGAHVIIGVIFLFVCLMRAYRGQFTPKHHVGFQFAAWYWHFVDVVWLFLFTCIYIWGSWGAHIEGALGYARRRATIAGLGLMMTEPLENVRVGMTGRHEIVVTRELTVGAHVEGMPFVFGTPMMILAKEIASGQAVAAHLPAGWATVGSEVNIRHLAPTPVGRTVVATARVIEVSGRSLCSRSRRMTVSVRSAKGRTGAARSIWRASPNVSRRSKRVPAASVAAIVAEERERR